MGGDDNALDFIGSFIYGSDFRIPVGALHFHSLQIAASSEYLQGVIGHLQGYIGSILLRHCRFHAIGFVVFLQFRRAVDKETGAAQLGCHIRQLKGYDLLLADGLSELYTFFGIFQRMFKCTLCNPQRLGGDSDASAVQRCHGDFEALSFLSKKVFPGNLYIVEYQFCSG